MAKAQNENGDASNPFWFDRLDRRSQVAALVISVASVAERVAIAILGEKAMPRSFSDWQAALTYIRRHTESESTGDLARWLDPEAVGGPTTLKSRNKESILTVAKGVGVVLAHYVRDDGVIARAVRKRGDGQEPETKFLRDILTALRSLAEGQGEKEDTWLLYEQLYQDDKKKRSVLVRSLERDTKQKSMETALSTFFVESPRLPHPLFQSRSIFDPLLLQAEFLPVRTEHSQDPLTSNCDMYAVIREARGWAPPNVREANMLVRDLLWIRYTDKPIQGWERLKQDDKPHGIYVSAMDRCCYVIQTIDFAGPNVIITAIAPDLSTNAQRLTLMFAGRKSRDPMLMRDGVISGSAGDNGNLAAWKALLAKPTLTLWPFFYHLRTILSEESTVRTANRLFDLCAETRAVGIIYTGEMRTRSKGVGDRRKSFRQLLLSWTPEHQREAKALGLHVRRELGDMIATTGSPIPKANVRDQRAVLDALEQYLISSWQLIEPAQIIGYKKVDWDADRLSPEDRGHLASLLALQDVEAYG